MLYPVFFLIFSIAALPVTAPDSTLILKSPAFQNGQSIPVKYTCDGQDISPKVSWTNVPKGTKSFTVIIDDPDAGATPWVHWVIFNIPKDQRALQEGIPDERKLKNGAKQGINDFKNIGYGGPCPPAGAPHQYVMTIYALDMKLNLTAGSTKADVVQAMKGHIVEKTVLKAPYKRRTSDGSQ